MRENKIVPERRLVTILFGDIKGFTSLSEFMDPEDVEELINEIFSKFREIIERNGGYVDKFIGDAVMAVFGAPRMHEDDTRRAIISAIEMQKVLKEINKERSMNLSIRIGINTGEVLWSSIAGEKPTVMGDAVNVAQRLESVCEPGKIFVSEKTQELAGNHFYFKSRGELKVKGRVEPVRVFEVLSEKVSYSEFLIRGKIKTPFLEREREIDTLFSLLRETISQHTLKYILIQGEAGIGKSRLSFEFTERAKEVYPGIKEFIVHADPLRQGAFLPVIQILRMRLEVALKEPDYVRKEIENMIKELGKYSEPEIKTFTRIVSELLYPQEISAEYREERRIVKERLAALRAIFEALFSSKYGNFILIFDDFHRSDPDTRDFIKFLTQHPPEIPLLLIINSREDIECMEHFRKIELPPLTQPSLKEIIGTIFDVDINSIDSSFLEFVVNKTGGNPYYIEELLLYLKEKELVNYNPLRLVEEGIFVPETLQGILVEKIDALPGDMKRVIKYAACIGKVFWKKVLDEISGIKTDDILTELELEGLIYREKTSTIKNDVEYSFKHELLRESTYSLLTRREREATHRKIGQILEGLAGDESILFNAAHHYKCGKEEQKAKELFEKAGDIAFDRGHFSFALTCYSHAGDDLEIILKKAHTLENLSQYKEAEELLKQYMARAEAGEDIYFQFKIRLASVYEKQSRFDEALKELQETESSQKSGIRTDALSKKAWILYKKSQFKEALATAREAIKILEQELEPLYDEKEILRRKGTLYNAMANIHYKLGEYEKALEYFTQAKTFFERISRKNSVASVLTNMSQVLMYQGKPEEARKCLVEALEIAKVTGNRFLIAAIQNNLSMVLMDLKRPDEALKSAEEALTIITNLGNLHAAIHILINIGRIHTGRKEFEKAIEAFRDALEKSRKIAYNWGTATSLSNLGFVLYLRNSLEEAEKYLEEAAEISEKLGNKYGLASTLHIIGLIKKRKKKWDEAIILLNRVIEIFKYLKNEKEVQKAKVELASVHYLRGDREKALDYLADIDINTAREFEEDILALYILLKILLHAEQIQEIKPFLSSYTEDQITSSELKFVKHYFNFKENPASPDSRKHLQILKQLLPLLQDPVYSHAYSQISNSSD